MIKGKEHKLWTTLKSEYLFQRPWLTVRRDMVQLPNGNINPEHYVLEYPSWVNVIAITQDGDMVMEVQYRHGLHSVDYEICAGVVEDGEDPLVAAKRELLEETGFGGGTWTKLMEICGNPSVTNNITHCYLAQGVKRLSDQNLEATEDIEVVLMKPAEVLAILQSDCMKQALMAAPLWKFFAMQQQRE